MNLMTINQARNLVCPVLSAANLGDDNNCLTSGCMAWTWAQSEYKYAAVPIGFRPKDFGWGKVVTRCESVIYRRLRLMDERQGYCAMMNDAKVCCMNHREHADSNCPMPMDANEIQPDSKAGAK